MLRDPPPAALGWVPCPTQLGVSEWPVPGKSPPPPWDLKTWAGKSPGSSPSPAALALG